MIKSSYSVLFRVELLHEYFLNRQCKDFEIVPASDSKILFNRSKIIYRNHENKLIAFIQQNDAGEPFYNTASVKNYRKDFGKSVFRFYLTIKNSLFFNYTNINFNFADRKKFYFSNLSQNKASNYLFLSAPLSPFSVDRQYIPGDIVQDPQSGKVYEALKKYTSTKKTELTDPLLWISKDLSNVNNNVSDFVTGRLYNAGDLVKHPTKDNIFEATKRLTANLPAELNDPLLWIPRGLGQLQYASGNDAIECCGGKYNFTFTDPVKKAKIVILGFNYNAASPAYDVPVKENEVKSFAKPTRDVPVDFSPLPPGKYAVKVNDETRIIYYDPVMSAGNVFGIIEIFNFLPGSSDYTLLTEDEKIKNINYQLLFAARRVLWKYIRKDAKAQTITDTGTTAYQFELKGDGFVSSSPIPLSENVLKTLILEFNTTDFKLSPLPNPSPERFSKCNQNDYDYLCSEIYLNY